MTLSRLAAGLATAAVAVAGFAAFTDHRIDARTAQATDTYPPLGRFVTVDGRRVHYVQEGQGPDLVLIHGASGNLREFTFRFIDRVRDRYRVTAFDRPGLGYTDILPALDTPWTRQGETPQSQAALLARAAAGIGVRNPIVLGHSYGGAVAMAWALDHDPAAAVVVSGATQPWPGGLGPLYTLTGSRAGAATLVPLISAYATDGIARSAVASIFAPQDPPAGYLSYIGAPLSLRLTSFRANARQVNTLRPELVRMAPRYPDLRLPVEIVHGTRDTIVPLEIHSEPLVRHIPGAVLTRVEGAGHMLHHVAVDPVLAAIDRAAARAGLR